MKINASLFCVISILLATMPDERREKTTHIDFISTLIGLALYRVMVELIYLHIVFMQASSTAHINRLVRQCSSTYVCGT